MLLGKRGFLCKGHIVKKERNQRITLHEISPITELRGITCHMGSRNVTCYPTQVNAPALTPASKLVLDLPALEGWKADLATVV